MNVEKAATPGKCRYCFKKINRKDNLRRHENETCGKDRIMCKCGKKIRKSSLTRHLQKYLCDLETNEMSQGLPNESTDCYDIHTKVRVTKLDDGSIEFKHDRIEIDGIQMVLIPASSVGLADVPSSGKFYANIRFYICRLFW